MKTKWITPNQIAAKLEKSPLTVIGWIRWSEGEGKNHKRLKYLLP